jgi:hypothetical protein
MEVGRSSPRFLSNEFLSVLNLCKDLNVPWRVNGQNFDLQVYVTETRRTYRTALRVDGCITNESKLFQEATELKVVYKQKSWELPYPKLSAHVLTRNGAHVL